jgi:hypothetical protein
MERVIDIFTLLALMVLTIFIYPFPTWVRNSGYIMFAGTEGLGASHQSPQKGPRDLYLIVWIANYLVLPIICS